MDQMIALDGAGNYSALMTTDMAPNDTFLHFDSGMYSTFDLTVTNASFPPWAGQYMEVSIWEGGSLMNQCFFDGFGSNFCSFPVTPFAQYSLQFTHYDGAIQFDVALQGL